MSVTVKERPQDQGVIPGNDYKSQFEFWDKKSWVRAKERREQPFNDEDYFYSAKFSSLFLHPEIRNAEASVRRKVLVYELYIYLEFAIWYEMGPVNDICRMLQEPDFLSWLPAQMKRDARRIYCDEGAHSEFSGQMVHEVEQHTGVKSLNFRPGTIKKLNDMVAAADPEFGRQIQLFFAIVIETLVTGTLNKVPRDKQVQLRIRELVRDHALDEASHHTYFAALFDYIWPRLPLALQSDIGRLLPEMIYGYLRPDADAMTAILRQFPQFTQPEEMVKCILKSNILQAEMLKQAGPTLSMLKKQRVFDNPLIHQAFTSAGLLQGAP